MMDCTNKQEYPKVIYFNNDDDFYTFSVNPKLFPKQCTDSTGNVSQYMDFDFTNAYKDAIDNNIEFVILDPNSQIIKHNNVLSYRTISKPVSNLNNYRYSKYLEKNYPDFKPFEYSCDSQYENDCE